MQETPQQCIQRILGFVSGKEPLEVQRETAKTLAKLIKPSARNSFLSAPSRASGLSGKSWRTWWIPKLS